MASAYYTFHVYMLCTILGGGSTSQGFIQRIYSNILRVLIYTYEFCINCKWSSQLDCKKPL